LRTRRREDGNRGTRVAPSVRVPRLGAIVGIVGSFVGGFSSVGFESVSPSACLILRLIRSLSARRP
jgi:hypothetical protein